MLVGLQQLHLGVLDEFGVRQHLSADVLNDIGIELTGSSGCSSWSSSSMGLMTGGSGTSGGSGARGSGSLADPRPSDGGLGGLRDSVAGLARRGLDEALDVYILPGGDAASLAPGGRMAAGWSRKGTGSSCSGRTVKRELGSIGGLLKALLRPGNPAGTEEKRGRKLVI